MFFQRRYPVYAIPYECYPFGAEVRNDYEDILLPHTYQQYFPQQEYYPQNLHYYDPYQGAVTQAGYPDPFDSRANWREWELSLIHI